MIRSKMRKTIITFLTVFALIVSNVVAVSAQGLHSDGVIILKDIEELEYYNGADGIYRVYMDDGRYMQITIKTTDNSTQGISTYATEYIQKKSFSYELTWPNGDLDWCSKLTGTFHFNKTYVWCTEGIAYSEFGDPDNSSITYSENTYSSAKVTGVSKYQIKAKIKTPTGTYNITQYVGSDPDGEVSYDMTY